MKATSQQTFGAVIRSLREEEKISQEALADKAGLHRTYISLLERGLRNPSLAVLESLARGLGVTAGELVMRWEAAMAGREE